MVVLTTHTQSIPKLSVPEFTVQIVNNHYLVPQTNSTALIQDK